MRVLYLKKYPLLDAAANPKKRRPKGVAVGRLSVARSDQRDPRLWLDSTIPNVNAKV